MVFSSFDDILPYSATAVAEFFMPPAVVRTLTLRVERLAAAGQFVVDALVADAHGRQLALQGWRCDEAGAVQFPANARDIPSSWLQRLHPSLVAALRILTTAPPRAPQALEVMVNFSAVDDIRVETGAAGRCVPALTRYPVCLPYLKRYAWARHFCGGGPVLDAGCGSGCGARIIADAGHAVLALVNDPSALTLARRRYDSAAITWRPADLVRPLPCADHEFQTALALEVIERLPAAAVAGYLRELRRVLRPGGMLVASLPNAHPELMLAEFTELLGQAGFNRVTVYGQQAWRHVPDILAESDFTAAPEPDNGTFLAVAHN